MAEDRWNGPFRLVGPSDLPPEDWDMIGAFYIPDERGTSPLDQSTPAGNANPWAAFADAPSQAPAYASDPWAAFPDVPSTRQQGNDWFATALPPLGSPLSAPTSFGETSRQSFGEIAPVSDPDVLSRFYASQAGANPDWSVTNSPPTGAFLSAPTSFTAMQQPVTDPQVLARFRAWQAANDPWTAFPDWPPAQAQFGDISPFAGSPDTPWSVPTSPLPRNAPWPLNEVSPMGALFSAPRSFGNFASQPAGDPWAAFPDWPFTLSEQSSYAADTANTAETSRGASALDSTLSSRLAEAQQELSNYFSKSITSLVRAPSDITRLGRDLADDPLDFLRRIGPTLAGLGIPELNVRSAARDIWTIPPTSRGRAFELVLGHNLPPNFPSIDIFNRGTGTATSIKSIDLRAATYQNRSALYSKLSGFINDLADFTETTYAGIKVSGITSRTLIIAVPKEIGRASC